MCIAGVCTDSVTVLGLTAVAAIICCQWLQLTAALLVGRRW